MQNDIQAGDSITIRTPQGNTRTGKAVMRSSLPHSWVINCGGPHGTPAVATPENIISIKKAKR